MKITISPADVRLANEALSRLAAARQWAAICQAAGVDVSPELDRIEANERIATGILRALETAQRETL